MIHGFANHTAVSTGCPFVLIEDDGQRESSPFINSDNDEEQYYEGKNMALFEASSFSTYLQIINVKIFSACAKQLLKSSFLIYVICGTGRLSAIMVSFCVIEITNNISLSS